MQVCAGTDADRPAVEALLANVDVAVILCHGYIAPGDHEVALMLAHAGRLPTTHAVAAASASRRGHRWWWRDAAALERAPTVLILAACSPGTSHVAGLGDRLGLYGAMRLRGTRSAIAPLWDVVPQDAARIIREVVRARLEEGAPLARATHGAGELLVRDGVPRWRSLCYGVEGERT